VKKGRLKKNLVACDNQVRGINSHHLESKIRRTGEISTAGKSTMLELIKFSACCVQKTHNDRPLGPELLV
jgi:hypothetical protein